MRQINPSYLRTLSGITIMDELRYEEMYDRYNMTEKGKEINCLVIEWVTRNTPRLYGHVRIISETKMI